jgi:DNA-binding winged helix-turn-helix (wHTH) protein
LLAFGPFVLAPTERRLEKAGHPVRVGGRALDLLIVLAEHAGEILPNHVLLKRVWGSVHVKESSLRFHIKNLRKALAYEPSAPSYIINLPGRGYCFAASVEQVDPVARTSATIGAGFSLPLGSDQILDRAR